ncbi:aspartic proteinase-like protein 2 isoform X1 [Punica granatum]|uniref:Aspartic proteinase-like protein 2 isoform X1 n=1 Tax=Punica granatum TaxID=22663 RepID=A0A6P8DBQ2_PUNGR|nr:aspartic proteinase-like protein 2 isoform X1 [Punica granatum]
MARALSPIQATVFLLLCYSSAVQFGLSTNGLLAPPHNGARPPMVLPLFPSPPNSSRASPDSRRRHLQGSDKPNARMSLHDDLLLNGYYTTRLWIGTQPQKFSLIVDTGSTVTYVPCSTCDQCGKHQDPKFQPEESSTYQPVKCNIDCNCDDSRVQCVYERQYAEMSSSSGVLGEDVVSFGNLSALPPQRVVFGCENVETGDLYSQHADGIMGLGQGDLSIVDQLVGKGVISDSFSLCYGGMEIGGGAMVLGGISPPSDMVFSYSDAGRSPYYNIDLKEIHVGGKPLHLNPKIFDGKYGSVLDSGTTYAYLPEDAFLAFKEAVMQEVQSLKQIRGPDPNYKDICFSGAGSDISQLSSSFPAVDMVFGNGQKFTLSPENYLFRHSKVRGAYCLGIFQNGKDPTTLLGGIIVRNTLVTYDREHSKIGFWKTNCSELWARLHLSSPASSTSNRTHNQSIDVTPSPAPTPSEEIQVGQITFEMSSSMNVSDLKNLTIELVQIVAHELDVNITQVHLLSLTPKENGSLIRWAILPGGLDKYISNSTAIDIISRLSEDRVQLPKSFGSYQFSKWHVEPPETRTWWQKHYLAVVLAVTAIFLIGLSASSAWLLWRWSQRTVNSYKPVDAMIPEQELQPL